MTAPAPIHPLLIDDCDVVRRGLALLQQAFDVLKFRRRSNMSKLKYTKHGNTTLARLDVHAHWAQVALSLGAVGAYVLAYIPLYHLGGVGVAALSALPVAVMGWFFGMRAGLLAGLLSFPLNTLLLNLAGHQPGGWDVVIRADGLMGTIVIILIGAGLGRLGDLNERLRRELADRRRTEEILARSDKERERLLVAEREQHLLAESLAEVTLGITSQISHAAVLDEILRQVQRLVPYKTANITLLESDTLRAVRWQGYEAFGGEELISSLVQPLATFPIDAEAARTGKPVITSDTYQDPRWIPLDETTWIRSNLIMPICLHDRVLGLLRLDSDAPGEFSATDAERLQPLTNAAAVALENARLFEQAQEEISERLQAEKKIQRQLQRLASLHSIDMAITSSLDLRVTLSVLLDQVTTQLNVDAADVLLLRPHTHALEYAARRGFQTAALQSTLLRPGEGYAGRAARERRPVSVPDLRTAEPAFARAQFVEAEAFVAYHAIPLIAKGQVKGVLEIFHRAPFDPDPEWLDFLKTLAAQAAIAIDNATLFDDLQRSNLELTLAYDTTLEGWARALDLRDEDTEGHTRRVTEMTLRLARAMGMGEAELVHIHRGALLHDIGKMGIPDRILLKPGPLTDEEWEIMRRHPVYAYDMLMPITYLRPALDIPYCHHERWDGSGYPRGLKGEQIPMAARIFAVADVWDALRSDRPYRQAWPEEKVLRYVREQAGTHFDPQMVDAFLKITTGRA